MKEIIFIAVYFLMAGTTIFQDDKNVFDKFLIAIGAISALAITGMAITNFISYTSDNTSTVRDIAVIIACICVAIASIVTTIIFIKKK